jgi:hypothetical protein
MDNPNVDIPLVPDTHIPVGSQVTITIGRNVGETPMSDSEWSHFLALVDLFVTGDAFELRADFGWFDGQGVWASQQEDSAIRVFVTGKAVTPDFVSAALSVIADVYHQDAIAWSYGPNLLARRSVRCPDCGGLYLAGEACTHRSAS